MDHPTSEPATAERASVARVYDYYLGGDHNYPVDREFARKMIETVPEAPVVARLNRGFLGRAVRYCAEAGIRQFLDIGSGIPTVGTVHEIAERTRAGSRVLYADVDPTAVAYGRDILAGHDRTAMVRGDLLDQDGLLSTPEAARLLDWSEPIAVLMLGVLHYVPDSGDPLGLVARYRDIMAPGSRLVLSHGTDEAIPQHVKSMTDLSQDRQSAAYMRTRQEVAGFLAGFETVDPGVVFLPQWRPEPGDEPGMPKARVMAYAAVGRKP
ncbi:MULTISPECIES: SAM-dependent methyltransferase [Thermomonosporaceae]|uniref:SAM-dependent methyltransferase n=1 Tax=Thermomonosporaceae TaxID=2012 RepID=UPI00255AF0E8|nr:MULTISPECIES: SAM-dependent methyltransferase [Thermomonosporaceae]MDL4776704.1 SAM-dependent methyltransferase [Actinomadura xylanilytica]